MHSVWWGPAEQMAALRVGTLRESYRLFAGASTCTQNHRVRVQRAPASRCVCLSGPHVQPVSLARSTARHTCRVHSQPNNAELELSASDDMPDSVALPDNFCIIEGRTTVQDFAKLGLAELDTSINNRRNRIFLLMEEVRRLRIQQRLKTGNGFEEDVSKREYSSAVPFLPPLTDESIKEYYISFAVAVAVIIFFGGVLAPTAELRMGLGGTTYEQFISSMGLPEQFAQVDPIVASFTGGAVGVISTLLVVEVNNVKENAKKRCMYCSGTGYLSCAQCANKGSLVSREGSKCFCPTCSGSGKVMCTSCLCTGLAMATEHDPRIDPFV